jgi:Spy/CpxP family protein refolding chaperone
LNVKKHLIGAMVLGVACMLAVTATAQPPGDPKGQPPGKGDGKGGFGQGKGGFGQGKGGFGQGGFGGRSQPGTIMSTFMQEQLKLTDEQKKQVAELQKEVDGKMDKILTDEQREQLKKIKEAGANGGGFGGRPGGGNPPPKKDPN